MRIFIFTVAIFLLLVLQAAVLAPLHFVPVNTVLVLLILALMFEDFNTALLVALSGGIMLDLLSGTSLGLITLSLVLLVSLGQVAFELFLARQPRWPLLGIAVLTGTAGWGICFLAVNWLFGWFGRGVFVGWTEFWRNQLWLIFFNLILIYPVLKYLSLINWVYAKSVRNRK